ncbi:uncharacterized protein N7469_001957 [Penicillium citrinum]|uniref:Uncharacterized protein n=1 Tax=Penicillium citrinum TaxID=5077 RepID=A0A9W9TT40_PENCI|nr:uncharacterized protein N7469_001957 [Penicillium citrinum]KAJ5240366.1 hypothetical protein N7469_001957 [Penicillium citrinum]
MPKFMIPSPAQSSAMRGPTKVVLRPDPPEWLLAATKYPGRKKRSSFHVERHVSELLSQDQSLWTLCSLLIEIPKRDSGEDNVLLYRMIHVKSFVIHVDMVSTQQEMTFGLTGETLQSLSEIYRTVHLTNPANGALCESLDETQLSEMQRCFDEASAKFVFRTDLTALEEIEDDGCGMLPANLSEIAKAAVLALLEKPKMAPKNVRAQFIDKFRNRTTSVPSASFICHTDDFTATASIDRALSIDYEDHAQCSFVPACCSGQWHQKTGARNEPYKFYSPSHLVFPSTNRSAVAEPYSVLC